MLVYRQHGTGLAIAVVLLAWYSTAVLIAPTPGRSLIATIVVSSSCSPTRC